MPHPRANVITIFRGLLRRNASAAVIQVESDGDVLMGANAVESGEAWSDTVIADLEAMSEPQREKWVELLEHCSAAKAGKPTKKWLKSAAELRESIGHEAVEVALVRWLGLIDRPRTNPWHVRQYWPESTHRMFIEDNNQIRLRGLCWIAGMTESDKLARSLGSMVISCYRKLPGFGPRAIKVGNAAVYALGQMTGQSSLAQLAMLSTPDWLLFSKQRESDKLRWRLMLHQMTLKRRLPLQQSWP